MIDIADLRKKDIGRWVEYADLTIKEKKESQSGKEKV